MYIIESTDLDNCKGGVFWCAISSLDLLRPRELYIQVFFFKMKTIMFK